MDEASAVKTKCMSYRDHLARRSVQCLEKAWLSAFYTEHLKDNPGIQLRG